LPPGDIPDKKEIFYSRLHDVFRQRKNRKMI
jgi:hypothetical protein